MVETRDSIKQIRPCLSRHPNPTLTAATCHRCWQHVNDARYKVIWGPVESDPNAVVINPVKPLMLGDEVERALSVVGVTQERVRAWLGDCNCEERKKRLNELGTWATRAIHSLFKRGAAGEELGGIMRQ